MCQVSVNILNEVLYDTHMSGGRFYRQHKRVNRTVPLTLGTITEEHRPRDS